MLRLRSECSSSCSLTSSPAARIARAMLSIRIKSEPKLGLAVIACFIILPLLFST